jgi:protein TonB
MNAGFEHRRDLAGWCAAAILAAALFGGAAAAALRLPPGPTGDGPQDAMALDLSVGVVPLSAVLPPDPPVMDAPRMPDVLAAPEPDVSPAMMRPVSAAEPPPFAPPEPRLDPVLNLPQADAPPVMAAAPPPPPLEEPPLELEQSPRPMARPDRPKEVARPAERQEAAAAPPLAPPLAPPTDPAPAPDPVPRDTARAAPAQPAGSDQAARPAQERRVAGGQSAARYGDTVMRQIAKLRRKKAPERGVVTVGFEIGADGGLRRVAVVSSSGSTALDQVAVEHIRRAAPFPPPPEGAATRFAFEFVGR